MIDHVSLSVRDLATAAAFYERLWLRWLPQARRAPTPSGSARSIPSFGSTCAPAGARSPNPGAHVALRASSEDAVRAFHAAALAAGGASDGEPGPRQAAMTTCYGAFVLDPDGNKLEAMYFPLRIIEVSRRVPLRKLSFELE